MPKIAIIVLHFANPKITGNCVESVKKLNLKNFKFEVIVVNNGSKGDLEFLKNKEIKIIDNGENLGFAEGNNVGLREALKEDVDYVLVLNNDTKVKEDLLVNLVEVIESDKSIGITAPMIYFAPGFEYHKDRYKEKERGRVIWYAGGIFDWKNVLGRHRGVDEVDIGQYPKNEDTDLATGCAFLVRKEVLIQVGLFDSRYFLYLEDVDFCQKVKRAGWRIVFVPKAKLWHLDSGSSSVGSELQDYFIARNRLLLGMKLAPWRAKQALIRESIRIWLGGRKWQKIGIRDFYLRKFGKGSWIS